jgi:uncharacterized phage-associated protein
MMTFRFDFEKTLQAAGVLLDLDGPRMDRLRLLKLLYIADRELLAETGRTLTGDRALAMKHGPVLGRVYDLIRGESSRAGEWGRSIHSDGRSVVLRDDPGRGELSRREVEKLTELTDRYRNVDDWALSEATHDFPEWSRNYAADGPIPIPWEDALSAQGRADLVEIVEREEATRRLLDDLLGS